jgi:hypothetical protein
MNVPTGTEHFIETRKFHKKNNIVERDLFISGISTMLCINICLYGLGIYSVMQ